MSRVGYLSIVKSAIYTYIYKKKIRRFEIGIYRFLEKKKSIPLSPFGFLLQDIDLKDLVIFSSSFITDSEFSSSFLNFNLKTTRKKGTPSPKKREILLQLKPPLPLRQKSLRIPQFLNLL